MLSPGSGVGPGGTIGGWGTRGGGGGGDHAHDHHYEPPDGHHQCAAAAGGARGGRDRRGGGDRRGSREEARASEATATVADALALGNRLIDAGVIFPAAASDTLRCCFYTPAQRGVVASRARTAWAAGETKKGAIFFPFQAYSTTAGGGAVGAAVSGASSRPKKLAKRGGGARETDLCVWKGARARVGRPLDAALLVVRNAARRPPQSPVWSREADVTPDVTRRRGGVRRHTLQRVRGASGSSGRVTPDG